VLNLIKTGQRVQLTTPTSPGKTIEGKISEIRSVIGSANRAFEAIVEVSNPGDWRPGASVNGAVVVAEHPGAAVVSEISVVQRPAGMVVYVVKDGKAAQRIVQVGERRDGVAEIVSGVTAGEVVAMDGAGFLTDNADVAIKDKSGTPGSGKK
jgi:RND family efflux transporter MFP subunit